MLKRTWSIRRPQTYNLTRRVEPGAALQRDKGMIRCQVTLLDDSVFTCDVDVSYTHNLVTSERILMYEVWREIHVYCS